MQLTIRLVLRARLGRASRERRESFRSDFLEDFVSTRVARVRVDQEQRLDLGYTGDDPSDGDELAEVCATDVSDSEDVGAAGWAEVDVADVSEGIMAEVRLTTAS